MRGSPAKPEFSPAERATSAQVPSAVVDAQAQAARVALLAVRGDGSLMAHNQQFARLCEVPTHVLEQGLLSELLDWMLNRGDEMSRSIAGVLTLGGTETSGELASSDGRTLEWRKVGVRGEPSYVWTFEDVSESRQMAAALVDAASWLRVLELHTDGALLELDADARIVALWGPSGSFFDQPDAALQGQSLAEAVAGPEGLALDARVRQVIASEVPAEYEYPVDIRGRRRVLCASAVLMPSVDDGARRVTLMLRDVTERAHMQAQLLQVERLASVGLLAAGVAHEINNPLAYVLLNLERIRSGLRRLAQTRTELEGNGRERNGLVGHEPELAELLDAVEMSIEGSGRVRSIVRDLNRFSRSDESVGLAVDAHRSLDFAMRMAEPEVGGRAKLVADFGTLPLVRASESRLSQIFLNLIINAGHAIPEGEPERHEIRVSTRTHASGQAAIAVQDTGRGMSSEAVRHIFEPFYTTKPPGMGTGLGLTICHGIATALGGRIEVESREGQGSVFRVLLPPAPEHDK